MDEFLGIIKIASVYKDFVSFLQQYVFILCWDFAK